MNDMKSVFGDFIDNAMSNTTISVSEDEIKALARFSNSENAEIYEVINKNNYMLMLSYDGKSEQVLIASKNKENYIDSTKEFFKKFIKYGGKIELEKVFSLVN